MEGEQAQLQLMFIFYFTYYLF